MRYAFAALILLSGVSAQNYSTVDLADVDIATAPNNTLFTRWRPTSHVMAPHSWMNDPCAPSYDPATGLYHIMYQFNPHHINWGNISWGHAISKDQVTWTDVNGWEDSLARTLGTGPPGTLDHLGVFSGSAQFLPLNQSYGLPDLPFTAGPTKETVMVVMYTAVQHLPTHWSIPYINGTETQFLVTSTDGGRTFNKFPGTGINPVIPGPPPNWNITGFRDPIYNKWPEMDDILFGNPTAGNFYAIFGSGIKGSGGRLPLYYAPANDLTSWQYLGPLFAAAPNSTWSNTYSGSFGFNFEMAGAFSLAELKNDGGDDVSVHNFIIAGTEGGNTTQHPSLQWALWSELAITRAGDGSVESSILSSGVLDWGSAYAWNSFWDAPGKRRIAYGWSREDLMVAQTGMGWQGVVTLPRHLYVKVYEGVVNTRGIISQRGSWTAQRMVDGTWKVTTLGMRPASEVVDALREGAGKTSVGRRTVGEGTYTPLDAGGISLNIHAEIEIPYNSTMPVGFAVRRSPNGVEQTITVYNPAKQELSVIRDNSTTLPVDYATTYALTAPLFLLDQRSKRETLTLDIFIDNSMIEVFANERVAITARVYPARNDSVGVGMWTGEGEGEVTFRHVGVWVGLKNVFPGRPANSSTELVFDTPAESGDGVWWAGN